MGERDIQTAANEKAETRAIGTFNVNTGPALAYGLNSVVPLCLLLIV